MPAANTDYFIKTRRNFSTQIGTGGVADASITTTPLASTTNLPTDTAVCVTVNRVDASGVVTNNSETVVGVVSGTNLINCTRGVEGTAQAWSAGKVVELLWCETNVNRMVTGLLVEHGQDGTHAATIVKTTATQTLTNKRITKREVTEASNATPTPNADTTDIHTITALAAAAAFAEPIGTPTQGQGLLVRIKDNGTARALTWNAIYRPMGTVLPTTTVLSKTLYLAFFYNSTDTKWDLVASAQEA